MPFNTSNYFHDLNSLKRFFNAQDSNGYAFAVAKDERIIPAINQRIIESANEHGKRIKTIFLEPEKEVQISVQIKDQFENAEGIIIRNIDDCLRQKGTNWLNQFNYAREALNQIGKPILFWVSQNNLSAITNHAPDLFSQRRINTLFFEESLELHEPDEWLEFRTEDGYLSETEKEGLKLKINLLKKQLKEMEAAGFPKKKIANDIVVPLALLYSDLENNNESINLLEKYKEYIDLNSEEQIQKVGRIYRQNGNIDTALEFFKKGQRIVEQKSDTIGTGIFFNEIAKIYMLRGDFEKALYYLNLSLEISNSSNDHEFKSTILNNLSQVYNNLNKYEESEKLLKECLKINKKTNNLNHQASTLGNLGLNAHMSGNDDLAINYFEKSLKLHKETGNLEGAAVALNNMSQIFEKNGEYDKALSSANQSLEISSKIGDINGHSIGLINAGELYYTIGNHSKSLKMLKRGLELSRRMGNKKTESSALNIISKIYLHNNKTSLAINLLIKSLGIQRQIENKKGETIVLFNLAIAFKKIDLKKFEEYMKAAYKLSKGLPYTIGLFHSAKELGNHYYNQGKKKQGLKFLKEAFEIGKKSGFPETAKLEKLIKQYQNE
ncbi:MAG: tetratricopeptide repeat protein [Saprospiraceae bacterium]